MKTKQSYRLKFFKGGQIGHESVWSYDGKVIDFDYYDKDGYYRAHLSGKQEILPGDFQRNLDAARLFAKVKRIQ